MIFLSRVELTSLPSTSPKFSQSIFILTPFMIILQKSNCKNSQLSIGKTKKLIYLKLKSQHSILNVDNFLNLISKSRIPVLSPCITFTCLFICSLFSSSLSFSLLFLHYHVNVFPLFRSGFLELQSSQSAHFKMKSNFYW